MSDGSLVERFHERLADVTADLIVHGESIVETIPGEHVTFRLIFESDMDRLTRELEHAGYEVWFTCEVDGVEHRLAARR